MTKITTANPSKIETNLSLGQVIERFRKFKGRAQLTGWGDAEHVYLVTHMELSLAMGYGFSEQPAQFGFSDSLCRVHPDHRIEFGWRPNALELFSTQWTFYNYGVRDDVYSESRHLEKAGASS